ncbi:MAG: hypothetical protein QW046_01845 [Candidatus Micrarchaeaceae archaeon]
MNGTEVVGLLIFVLGILILLFTFYEAYLLYEQMLYAGAQKPPQVAINATSASTPQGIVQGVVQGILGSMQLQQISYDFLAIILLLVFASVGYKVAKLGIELRSSERRKGGNAQQKEQK